jgi:hypothetical protein
MATSRSLDQVSREIAREREELASAVAHLRGELKQAADMKAILKAQAPKLVGAAALLVAGLVAQRLLRRPSPPPPAGRAWVSVGRFTILERYS